MIIVCTNCNKKFNIDSSLIPDNGRLLQCSSCNHKWFFKNKTIIEPIENTNIDTSFIKTKVNNDSSKSSQIEVPNHTKLLDNQINEDISDVSTNKVYDTKAELSTITFTNKKNYNILALIMVFIISFIALIIILDTFQSPISKIIPDIEFILYNLYETINDVRLFLADLF